jgi:hypothetical protein
MVLFTLTLTYTLIQRFISEIILILFGFDGVVPAHARGPRVQRVKKVNSKEVKYILFIISSQLLSASSRHF